MFDKNECYQFLLFTFFVDKWVVQNIIQLQQLFIIYDKKSLIFILVHIIHIGRKPNRLYIDLDISPEEQRRLLQGATYGL